MRLDGSEWFYTTLGIRAAHFLLLCIDIWRERIDICKILMSSPKPTHFLMLFSYGEHFWTQLTVMSFLSAQNRLEVDIPKFRTVVVTDKPRYIKAYFGSWIEIISINPDKLKEITSQNDGHWKFKLGMMYDFVRSRGVKVLSLESDVYFNKSPLEAFNYLDEGKLVAGQSETGIDKAIFGFDSQHLTHVEKEVSRLDSNSDTGTALFRGENRKLLGNYFHYNNELNERSEQIKRFFERNYYREMGELYTMAGLFTPNLWHLPESELPQELL